VKIETVPSPIPSTHLGIWACGSTSRRHTGKHGSSAAQQRITQPTDLLTARGVANLVVHGTTGSTSYETIPPVRLETSGGVLSTVDMLVQRRDGPRRLRDHDGDGDDDDINAAIENLKFIKKKHMLTTMCKNCFCCDKLNICVL